MISFLLPYCLVNSMSFLLLALFYLSKVTERRVKPLGWRVFSSLKEEEIHSFSQLMSHVHLSFCLSYLKPLFFLYLSLSLSRSLVQSIYVWKVSHEDDARREDLREDHDRDIERPCKRQRNKKKL